MILLISTDQGVSVMRIIGDHDAQQQVDKFAAGSGRVVNEWREIQQQDIPVSRYFRNQWQYDAGKVTVNMAQARAHKMALIRAERDNRLIDTDRDYAKEHDIGNGNVSPVLKAKRQALRDLPAQAQADIDLITDAAQLENYEPVWP